MRSRNRMKLAVVRGVHHASPQLKLDCKDAISYLEMNDWKVADAIEEAVGDLKWEIDDKERKEKLAKKIADFEAEELSSSPNSAFSIETSKLDKSGLPFTYRRVHGDTSSVEAQVEMGLLSCVPLTMRLQRIFTGFSFFRR